MRNLKLVEYSAVQSIPGSGKCIIAENAQGKLGAVCGRKLWKLDDNQWAEVMDVFDMDDDEVVSFEAIFGKFCAISKLGQIVTCQLEAGTIEPVGDIFGGIRCARWSPDLELLVVIAGNGQLLLMRENFDTVLEQTLETEELGEKSAITVGWGKKETQFHGSEGKKAAKTVVVQRETLADFDDQKPYIIWRNDGQHFATNTVHENMRKIRIWSRDGILEYTAEDIPRLHGGLAWWWGDENLIVSVDTSAKDKRRIIFYETNGLRHGEFDLPRNCVVKEISQGTLRAARALTVWFKDVNCDVILIYTMNNYHWYPKQTLKFPEAIRGIIWDSQEYLRVLAGEKLHQYKWIFSVNANNRGLVTSIDGDRLLQTDLSRFIIPPPMAGVTYIAPQPVNQIVHLENSTLALGADGSIVSFCANDTPKSFVLPEQYRTTLIHLEALSETRVSGVHCSDGSHHLVIIDLPSEAVDKSIDLEEPPECLCVSEGCLWVKFEKKFVQYSADLEILSSYPSSIGKLEQLLCCGERTLVGFNASERKVYFKEQELCSDASSVVLHGDSFILVTTLDNTLRSFPIFCEQQTCCDSRQLEIGSLLVTSVPVDGRVILQMPRGNLETIYPRPLLLRDIHGQLSRGNYAEAFRLMKVNRINLNLFYDDDPDCFADRVDSIVEQIRNSADLNLLIMDLKEEDVTKTMYKSYYSLLQRPKVVAVKDIARICDVIRAVCLQKDLQNRHLSVVTCYAKKNTIEDLEEALRWISHEEGRFDETLRYLLLLVDVKQLMDVALGLYDFKLFLKVAQFSQVDPKEYLSLLKEMKTYEDENYRKYKIDLHLKRYERALKNIAKCPDHFVECLELVVKERLYTKTRNLFPRDSPAARALTSAHAEYLFSKKYYKDAAILFVQARDYQRASQCFERASCTSLCLEAARLADLPLEPVVKRIIATLISESKHSEAGSLMKEFNYPADDFCSTFIEGGCWEQAYCSLHLIGGERQDYQRRQLEETLLSQSKNLDEKVTDIAGKLQSHVKRLEEVRESKSTREGDCINFYDDSDFPMSEAGSMVSGASRGRSARSSAKSGSITTLQTNKQIRKAKKPRYTLKQGSPYEDLAIVQECFLLIEKVTPLSEEIGPLLHASQLLGLAHEAVGLQNKFSELLLKISKTFLATVWPEIPEGEPQVISDVELRGRPKFPENLSSSLLFSTRW